MGHTCHGTALIGYRIPIEVFRYERKVKAFQHDYPDDWVADPKTGQKLWTTETLYGKGFGDTSDPWTETWEGFPAKVVLNDDGYRSRNGFVYIGAVLASASDYGGAGNALLNTDTIGIRVAALKAQLQEHGLPTTDFGLWCVLGNY